MDVNMMVPVAISAITAGVLGCVAGTLREARALLKGLREDKAQNDELGAYVIDLEHEIAQERRLHSLAQAELKERREEIDNLEIELVAARQALTSADLELDQLSIGRFATSAPRR